MRFLGLASLLALTALPIISRADETIVLDLPSSRAQTTVVSTKKTPPTRTATRSRGRLASRQGAGVDRRGNTRLAADEKVVGRLGVASVAITIRAERGSGKRALAKVQPGTYLALTGDSGDYYGVLMSDRSTGWVLKRDVNVLDYQVVAPDMPDQRDTSPTLDANNVSGAARTILETAYSFLGVPYVWGGTSPKGMDCSAFVRRCFSSVGIRLPRTAHEQITEGMPVDTSNLQAADRLYFADRSGRITHTGIYIGNGYFIHSSSSRGGVAVSRLDEPLYRRMYAGARR